MNRVDNLINFLIDILSYGFLDALTVCFIAYTINYKDISLSDIIKQAFCVDIILCIINLICPLAIYSQLFMSLGVAIFFILYNKEYSLNKYLIYCCPVIAISILEFFIAHIVDNIFSIELLFGVVNSFYRLCAYGLAKSIVFIIFYTWRRIRMKIVLGGVVRR